MSNKVKDMTEGNPFRLILFFAIPMMLGNLFQQAYFMVDALIVGRALGVSALAAVGSADWYTYMILIVVQAVTQGFSIMIAQDFGAGNKEHLRKTLAHTVKLCAVLSILILAAAELALPMVLDFLHTPDEIRSMTILYNGTFFAGVPAMMLYNMGASTLRSVGNSRAPLTAMILSSGTNMLLDFIFVVPCHMGIFGAAFATVLSEAISGIYCIIAISRISELHFSGKDLEGEEGLDLKLLKLSVPLIAQNILVCIGGLIMASVENSYGVDYVAGYTTTNKFYAVLEMGGISFGYAMMTYSGQNFGSGKKKRIREGVKAGSIIAVIFSIALASVMLFLGPTLVSAFITGDAANAAAAKGVSIRFLRILSYPLPILYLLYIVRNALQGIGDTMAAMASGIAEFLVRISIALVFAAMIGTSGIMLAEPLSWTAALLVLLAAYIQKIVKKVI